ncbi:hypothetical protein [Elongatibacter sediminis]|uniref:Coiled coil domain-containing protein n=1 Tax=Elongatibacter sediminis TaxID=3119006 RepID=A0AAW9R4L4_9GAMM
MSETRKAMMDKLDAKVELAGARLNLLRAKARDAEADQRVKLNEKIRELESRRDDASDQLDRLKDASGDAWQDLRDGAEEAWQSLSSAVSDATARYQ